MRNGASLGSLLLFGFVALAVNAGMVDLNGLVSLAVFGTMNGLNGLSAVANDAQPIRRAYNFQSGRLGAALENSGYGQRPEPQPEPQRVIIEQDRSDRSPAQQFSDGLMGED